MSPESHASERLEAELTSRENRFQLYFVGRVEPVAHTDDFLFRYHHLLARVLRRCNSCHRWYERARQVAWLLDYDRFVADVLSAHRERFVAAYEGLDRTPPDFTKRRELVETSELFRSCFVGRRTTELVERLYNLSYTDPPAVPEHLPERVTTRDRRYCM